MIASNALLFVVLLVFKSTGIFAQSNNNNNVDDQTTDCKLCKTEPLDPDAQFMWQEENPWTCQALYQDPPLILSELDCSILQEVARRVCFCDGDDDDDKEEEDDDEDDIEIDDDDDDNDAKDNFDEKHRSALFSSCSGLCQDGNSLPEPSLQVLPPWTCSDLQIDAIFDLPENCIYHQMIFGTYCGCHNNTIDLTTTTGQGQEVCQLCPQYQLLPDPKRIVGNLPCLEHEFRASLYQECTQHQDLYAQECCMSAEDNAVSVTPTTMPTTFVPSSSLSSRNTVTPTLSIIVGTIEPTSKKLSLTTESPSMELTSIPSKKLEPPPSTTTEGPTFRSSTSTTEFEFSTSAASSSQQNVFRSCITMAILAHTSLLALLWSIWA